MKKGKVAEDTPMLKQYFSVKAENPEAILLYRVGDFYETYSDDALLASKVLGLVLTKRSNGDKGSVAMAGFPHHALNVYLPKLVRAGYKVAVCDQLEDPRLTGRKLVKRGVTELVTPGVAFGDEMLDQKENNYLLGLCLEGNLAGAAFLDVSTGSFRLAQGSKDYISTLIASLSPKELVIPRSSRKIISETFGDDLYYSTLEEWAFVYDAAAERIKRQFDVDTLKGFPVEDCPLGLCSAGALMVYLEQTHHIGLKNICTISRIQEGDIVWMDRFTLRNLEVLRSTSVDGVALTDVLDRCSSPMGSRLMRAYLAMPTVDIDELERRYDVVGWLTEDAEALEAVSSIISGIGDLERLLSRAATGKISPKEMISLAKGLSQIGPLSDICTKGNNLSVKDLGARMKTFPELEALLSRSLVADPPTVVGKGDTIDSGVDAELDSLREIARGGKDYLQKMQDRESERTEIPSLKIGYNNVFGYYLEVRNTYKDRVPPEWVRKQTLVGAERYITQELKEYEEKILTAEDRIYAIETRIVADLIAAIQAQIPEIQNVAKVIARLDVLQGFAAAASSNGYCRPVMNNGTALNIKAGRHPVIETLMKAGEEYIPNDIYLDSDKEQIIILTGPNMAGKSALLRQTALIVLMAQAGSFVPAKSAEMGIVDKIFTRVGASDNISRGESTFMVEMLETSTILHNLSARSLVLLDEIGRGTSTYDGMSIARAIVSFIHDYGHGAKTLFATHYHELNDLEGLYPRVKNYHITVKESGSKVIFLRKIAPGGSAHSFGIHVARMAGMPPQVIKEAEKTLSELERRSAEQNAEAIQLSLFQLDDPTLSSIRDRLELADLDNMTPLGAFDLLRSLKEELGI